MPLHQVSSTPSKLCNWGGIDHSREGSIGSEDSLERNGGIEPTHFPTAKYRCLVDRIRDRIERKVTFCSFEFFPPKTNNGAANLIKICDYLTTGNPLFCDVTWKTGGDNSSDEPTSTLTIASTMVSYCGLDTMMHMTCVGQSRAGVMEVLNKAKQLGIKNILALRGDLPQNCDTWQPVEDGFHYAVDLVKFIRSVYGNYFVICVAGYPTGHPDAPSYEEDLYRLKEKVDAGADFIITQLFFKSSTFIKFYSDCREIGITCPILPGILPIQAYQSLENISRLSKLEVPADIWEKIRKVKDNDEAVRKFGIDHGIELCRELLKSEVTYGLHFYTLNREYATVEILKALGMWSENPRRSLPWKTSAHHTRCMESVRPIFWSARPESYIFRTSGWEEFPNGRWGNSASASFRDSNDYYLFYLKPKIPKSQLLKMWGEKLTCEEDIWNVFACYLSAEPNNSGVKVTCTPWNDDALSPETVPMVEKLAQFNKRGVLTTNSQPCVNGAPSTHPVFGWGNPGGYIYQKAYLEFFTSRRNAENLLTILKGRPHINYHVVNNSDDFDETNCDALQPSALTWGVFPNMEIVQPTVYDPVAFKFWKGEAFGLWKSQWGVLYEEGSESQKVINKIHNEYCLVNLIDNDFVKDSCLFEVVEEMLDFCKWN